MILETGRLILRELKEEDYDALCKILRDPEVMYAYEHAFSGEESREWLERQFTRYKTDGFGLWAVILKESRELIGQCGITLQEIGNDQVQEVGYLFRKEFWYKGYALEAAVACREYAFETLHAPEVYSIIRDNNAASQRVAECNGMKRCGEIVKHYYNMDMPHYLYKMTREEWERQKKVDRYSYQLGVIDCFNEMVHAGLKRIAMSHPCKSLEERNSYLGFCNEICRQYGTAWYPENDAFITDLFPEELNKGTYNIIFYRVSEDLDTYLELKKRKVILEAVHAYEGEPRYKIAWEFGKLLSYTDEAIARKIAAAVKSGNSQNRSLAESEIVNG